MEVLFEYRGSRRQLGISDKESITRVVSAELQRIGKSRAQVFTANDDLPSGRRGGSGGGRPDVYLLQKWSDLWDCYVDVAHCNEVCDGDRLAVIAKPKPPSRVWLLCCCGTDSSYRVGKVGGSKNKIPKTEEIQSLEYRYRVELEAVSDWENVSTHTEPDPQIEHADGEQYIRAESGRAAWKLAESDADSRGQDSAIEIEDVESDDLSGRDEGNMIVDRGSDDAVGGEELGREESIDEQQTDDDGDSTGKEPKEAAVSQEEDDAPQDKDQEASAEESVEEEGTAPIADVTEQDQGEGTAPIADVTEQDQGEAAAQVGDGEAGRLSTHGSDDGQVDGGGNTAQLPPDEAGSSVDAEVGATDEEEGRDKAQQDEQQN